MNDRRVVVTGLGTINPVGDDVESTWQGLLSGTSGVGPITQIDASDITSRIAGEVSDFDVEAYIPRRQARRMDRFAQYFLIAGQQALADAGISYEGGRSRLRSAPASSSEPGSAASTRSRKNWRRCSRSGHIG